mmetsp:Transcript_52224/g.93985  ORF Transcript_52224/g.93985 Transcript_52224/m.93985 type:complete len:103 (-) Transcript_52224:27-335(-)
MVTFLCFRSDLGFFIITNLDFLLTDVTGITTRKLGMVVTFHCPINQTANMLPHRRLDRILSCHHPPFPTLPEVSGGFYGRNCKSSSSPSSAPQFRLDSFGGQ